jgi:hypothetical protein
MTGTIKYCTKCNIPHTRGHSLKKKDGTRVYYCQACWEETSEPMRPACKRMDDRRKRLEALE